MSSRKVLIKARVKDRTFAPPSSHSVRFEAKRERSTPFVDKRYQTLCLGSEPLQLMCQRSSAVGKEDIQSRM